jgi:hypothetical protein
VGSELQQVSLNLEADLEVALEEELELEVAVQLQLGLVEVQLAADLAEVDQLVVEVPMPVVADHTEFEAAAALGKDSAQRFSAVAWHQEP